MNVLLLRSSALGDVVHCLPVLRALRRALPEARIGWVVEEIFAPILEGHPDLDVIIPVRLRAWRKNLWAARHEMRRAFRTLRDFRADVALDLMGNHKAGLLARLSGAPRIVGAARRFRREPSSAIWIRQPVELGDAVHAVDRALAVAAGMTELDLAARGAAERAPAERAPAERAPAERAPADFGGDLLMRPAPPAADAFVAERKRPYVLIQAGAGWGSKTYPPALWGEVAHRLAKRTGVEIWVPIAPGEEHLARKVAESSRGAAQTVDAGPFPFLAALLRGAQLLLGGDTGPLHLAHALGTPVLAVMGPTDPARHGPYGEADRVVWRRMPCSFCYKRFEEARPCLLHVPPAEIADRATTLLERPEP